MRIIRGVRTVNRARPEVTTASGFAIGSDPEAAPTQGMKLLKNKSGKNKHLPNLTIIKNLTKILLMQNYTILRT
jgi:hypothetical protein